ncbi:hypothetical protein AFM16_00655 [Streptomyces antibioticus]|uniref:Uncharacterized protein n=1 Tax=Streptomyces antibioticus TaxID=1890 RepID=A0ABX3LQN3_STRAT|nr:hypothetical protein AFM16_00655 [Streptomyces antibioticus]
MRTHPTSTRPLLPSSVGNLRISTSSRRTRRTCGTRPWACPSARPSGSAWNCVLPSLLAEFVHHRRGGGTRTGSPVSAIAMPIPDRQVRPALQSACTATSFQTPHTNARPAWPPHGGGHDRERLLDYPALLTPREPRRRSKVRGDSEDPA